MTSRLLASFAHEEVEQFTQDFMPLIRMTIELDSEYGNASEKALYNLPVYRKYVAAFNNKYKGLFAAFSETTEGFGLKLFIKEGGSVFDIFMLAASKIEGMTSIGTTATENIPVHNTREFELQKRQIAKRMHITYSGDTAVFLKYDDAKKMIEVIYNPKEILNDDAPAFKICAFYALKKGYAPGLNLNNLAGMFSADAKGAGRASYGPNR